MFITNSVETARIGVIGLGYVGLPLAVEADAYELIASIKYPRRVSVEEGVRNFVHWSRKHYRA